MPSYVYRITELSTGIHYYGSHKSKLTPTEDLGINYFTSSKIVGPLFKTNPSNFKTKIVAVYDDYIDALCKEHKLLRKVSAITTNKDKFYNRMVYTSDSKIRIRFTPEILEKMRISHLGNPGKKKGHKSSPETCEKIRLANRARAPKSEETRKKLSAALKGKPKSAETRAKMSAASKGKIISPEQRAKISATLKGRDVRKESLLAKQSLSQQHKIPSV